tara:strand:- start:1162 stop:1461 length:300 start_codon:yes stop_codon:yes gene_type:complete
MPPFEEFGFAAEAVTQTIGDLTSNTVSVPSGVFTVTNGSTKLEVKSTQVKVTGDLVISGELKPPTNSFKVKDIRGVAHGLGVGVLHYNTSTKEITYSTN